MLLTSARILAVCAAFGLTACRVAMVGDSITEGSCSSDPCTGWVELVAAELPNLDFDYSLGDLELRETSGPHMFDNFEHLSSPRGLGDPNIPSEP